jgi:gliding motility-associated protein GldM
MAAFTKQMSIDKAKVKPYYDKALKATQLSDTLVAYLNKLQNRLIIATEFGGEAKPEYEYILKTKDDADSIVKYKEPRDIPAGLIKKKDNFNIPMEIFITEVPGKVAEAEVMIKKFAEYNTNMLALLSPEDRKDIQLGLNTNDVYNPVDRKVQTWAHNSFHHTVLVADLVLVNKYISEVLNTQSEVLNKLYSYIDAQTIKFDAVRAAVIPKSNVVIAGSDYEADIFVAAYSKTEIPTVDIKKGVDTVTVGSMSGGDITHIGEATNGIIKYKFRTGATGEFKYAGFIYVKDPSGKPKPYHFTSAYTVIQPSATVSADKVNVVYKGIPNPISASAPGFTNDKINLSVSGGGSLSAKGNGKYMYVPPTAGKEISFGVSGKKADGTTVNMGSFKFRVLPVPPPTIRLAGKSEGTIDRAVLASSPFLTANLDNFLFELKYAVTRFEIIAAGNNGTIVNQAVTGNKLPSDVVNKLKNAPKGTIVIISTVQTKGDDGEKRAPGITLKLI